MLLIGVCCMFWALAVVCEEYFVPALNILCEELNVSNDVAGATFMAAGASSPELFTAFIALFVNHSSIGVGTVVGSEIFNHMIISAGSVLYADGGVLYLDKWVFTRDIMAYLVALLTLIFSLKGSVIPAMGRMMEESEKEKCLDVTLRHSGALLVIYAAYVLVAAYFKRFRVWASGIEKEEAEALLRETKDDVDSVELGESDGANPLHADVDAGSVVDEDAIHVDSMESEESGSKLVSAASVSDSKAHRWRSSYIEQDMADVLAARRKNRNNARIVVDTLFPPMNCVKSIVRSVGAVNNHALSQVEVSKASLSGYMYCQGTKHERLLTNATNFRWRLRYFTLDGNGFHSRKAKTSPTTGPHIRLMNLADVEGLEIVDASTGRFNIVMKTTTTTTKDSSALEVGDEASASRVAVHESANPPLCFIAPGSKSFKWFTDRLRLEIEREKKLSTADSIKLFNNREILLHGEQQVHSDDHSKFMLHRCDFKSLLIITFFIFLVLAAPSSDGVDPLVYTFHSFCHTILYPLKFSFYHTIPDVTIEGNRGKYRASIAISVFWLAILSYVMICCCEALGVWVGTSPLVMGLTLSAIGTSFPNMYASMLVARQGQGNMAISNALGSNVFNICIALGLPWFAFIAVNGGKDYTDMQDDGIVFMLLLLIIVLVIYYGVVMFHEWQIQRWMATIYIIVYLCILGYAIVQG